MDWHARVMWVGESGKQQEEVVGNGSFRLNSRASGLGCRPELQAAGTYPSLDVDNNNTFSFPRGITGYE